MLIQAAGILLFLRAGATADYIGVLLPALLVHGVGNGLSFPSLNIAAVGGLPDEQQGLASGLITSSIQIGAGIGVALLASLMATGGPGLAGSLSLWPAAPRCSAPPSRPSACAPASATRPRPLPEPRPQQHHPTPRRLLMTLDLTPDQLLSTTRAVRKRLDLDRPVPRSLIEECVDLATQAPTGRNRQRWHFVVVTDPDRRRLVGDIFRRALTPGSMERISDGLRHLHHNIHRVPAFVVPAIEGRTEGASVLDQSMTWGSILPAVWSFMLAARARGLGTVWTTAQGPLEKELADALGVPYDEVMLTAFIPLAFTIGTDFKPARRIPREQVLHWEQW
jgi:nitroreductase